MPCHIKIVLCFKYFLTSTSHILSCHTLPCHIKILFNFKYLIRLTSHTLTCHTLSCHVILTFCFISNILYLLCAIPFHVIPCLVTLAIFFILNILYFLKAIPCHTLPRHIHILHNLKYFLIFLNKLNFKKFNKLTQDTFKNILPRNNKFLKEILFGANINMTLKKKHQKLFFRQWLFLTLGCAYRSYVFKKLKNPVLKITQ